MVPLEQRIRLGKTRALNLSVKAADGDPSP